MVQLDIGLIRKIMDTFHTRLTEAEGCVGESEDTLYDYTTTLHTLKTKMKTLDMWVEDAENRNRRNNLHNVGLLEGLEDSDPMAFTEQRLRNLLPHTNFSSFFVVERAHSTIN